MKLACQQMGTTSAKPDGRPIRRQPSLRVVWNGTGTAQHERWAVPVLSLFTP